MKKILLVLSLVVCLWITCIPVSVKADDYDLEEELQNSGSKIVSLVCDFATVAGLDAGTDNFCQAVSIGDAVADGSNLPEFIVDQVPGLNKVVATARILTTSVEAYYDLYNAFKEVGSTRKKVFYEHMVAYEGAIEIGTEHLKRIIGAASRGEELDPIILNIAQNSCNIAKNQADLMRKAAKSPIFWFSKYDEKLKDAASVLDEFSDIDVYEIYQEEYDLYLANNSQNTNDNLNSNQNSNNTVNNLGGQSNNIINNDKNSQINSDDKNNNQAPIYNTPTPVPTPVPTQAPAKDARVSFNNVYAQQNGDDPTDVTFYSDKSTASYKGTFSEWGLTVWQNSNEVASVKDVGNPITNSYINIWFNSKKYNINLSADTDYTYRFYTIFDGVAYYGPTQSYRTGSIISTNTKTVYVYYHFLNLNDRGTVSPDAICDGNSCLYPNYEEIEVDHQLTPSGKYSSYNGQDIYYYQNQTWYWNGTTKQISY